MRVKIDSFAGRSLAVASSFAAILAAHLIAATPATAGTPALVGVGRVAAPLVAHVEATSAMPAPMQQAAEQAAQQLPEILDPASGPVFSILGGSVFSGASAFQTGAALAYFFGDKANIGFEIEGDITFGPGGRVAQVMGSFVYQTGARTSKFVPFFAAGGGYLRATSEYPTATQEVLDEFGIDPQPRTEEGPFIQWGGGLRYYVKPRVAFRADVRFALVPLNLEEETDLWDRMFGMSRVAGMLSFDF